MELYNWQQECLQAWEANRYHGIVNVVTGAGKTVLALAAIRRLRDADDNGLARDLRVYIVVPTVSLAEQWKRSLSKEDESGESWFAPGIYGGENRDRAEDHHVMIYIINSARDVLASHIRRDFSLGRRVFLICDECHHYQSPANSRIFRFLPDADRGRSDFDPDTASSFPSAYACLGLSATPFDTERDDFLRSALGPEIYQYGHRRAVREKVISPFTLCHVSVGFNADEREQYARLSEQLTALLPQIYETYPVLKHLQGTAFIKMLTRLAKDAEMDPEDPAGAYLLLLYRRKEITILARQRSRCCLRLLDSLRPDARALIFCERIAQAQALSSLLERKGYRCALYHSQIPADVRRGILRTFRDGERRILITCKCLDEGTDVPDVDTAIVLSGSTVSRQRIQRLGRIVRRSKEKDSACLYYLYVRESNDERSFLNDLQLQTVFDLTYHAGDDSLANDAYETTALALFDQAKASGMDKARLAELRLCLNEGLARADYLLDEAVLRRKAARAETIHEQNYWYVMRKISCHIL